MFETMFGFLLCETILLIASLSFWAIAGLAIKFDWPDWIWWWSFVFCGWCALSFQGVMLTV